MLDRYWTDIDSKQPPPLRAKMRENAQRTINNKLTNNKLTMKPTTRKRYERIRQAAAHMYGTMPVMHLYAALAHDFDLSEERIRKILAKNAPP